MKKSAFLALACAALISASAVAQTANEIVYVEDPAQGYTMNRFKDNWFITVDGGVNVALYRTDKVLDFKDRLAPTFGLYAGKWFSPILGARFGVNYMGIKGACNTPNVFGLEIKDGQPQMVDGKYYKNHVAELGADLDLMLNITNWWCGYKPNRVYNFVVYGGGGVFWGMQKKVVDGNTDGWDHKNYDKSLYLRAGIINSFNLNKHIALSLDLRYTCLSATNENGFHNELADNAAALLGFTYYFNRTSWTAPVVPVIPVIEDCDPIRARLAECEARLAQTQKALDDCLNRPMPKAPEAAPCIAPLATVYFPCGVSTVSSVDKKVLKSVASVMTADTNVKYDVCGWADNYTGTDAINARLRTNRANNVKNILVKNGVNADQLNVTTNPGDRYTGKENVYLDRCVTIQAVK